MIHAIMIIALYMLLSRMGTLFRRERGWEIAPVGLKRRYGSDIDRTKKKRACHCAHTPTGSKRGNASDIDRTKMKRACDRFHTPAGSKRRNELPAWVLDRKRVCRALDDA